MYDDLAYSPIAGVRLPVKLAVTFGARVVAFRVAERRLAAEFVYYVHYDGSLSLCCLPAN